MAQEKEYQYYDKHSQTFHNVHFTYDAYHPDYLFRGMAGLQELDDNGNLLPSS